MSVQSISFSVPKMKKRRWGKPKPGESLKMLAAGSLAFAKAYSSVEKLEHELEAEIQRDKESEPKKGVARWRNKGGKMLLNKYVLLFIVALNTIDCALVLGELILDLHHVKDILTEAEETSEEFIGQLKYRYPDHFLNLGRNGIEEAYKRILLGEMRWAEDNNDTENTAFVAGNNGTYQVFSTYTDSANAQYTRAGHTRTNSTKLQKRSVKRDTSDAMRKAGSSKDVFNYVTSGKPEPTMSTEEIIGHALHIASMTICCILVLWVSLKIICFGKQFKERKLEVFDACIIFLSFVVDLIFLEGLTMYSVQEFVFILAFMLPWRVIRVTNSLVVTVRDHEHFRLKLLYTQKKKVEGENKQIRVDRDNYKEQVDALKKLCLSEGIDDWKIFQSLARQQIRPGKGAMGSFASLAFGAIGNAKSSSIWSVLATPKMRRGKSMESVDNQRVAHENHYTKKRHSKGRILSFLGNSTEFFRGKMNNSKQLSVDSDPGFQYVNSKCNNHAPGGCGKRLLRGETIDTVSTDTSFDGTSDLKIDTSFDGHSDTKNCSFEDPDGVEDFERQDTVDSSVFDECSNECSNCSHCSSSRVTYLQTPSIEGPNHTMHFVVDESPIIRRPPTVPTPPLAIQISSSITDESD